MRIAIQKYGEFQHSLIPIPEYIKYCHDSGLDYGIVDAFDKDIVTQLNGYDIFIWYPGIHSISNQLITTSLLKAVESMGILVYPNSSTGWHFDNKIAETFYLDTINAPIPKYWAFFDREKALYWIRHEAVFPIVAKLKSGAGSNNVRLLKNSSEAESYTKRMFGRGFSPVLNIFLKASSHYHATRGNWQQMKKRIARVPEFLRRYFKSKEFPNEKGYVYFQEFVPNDRYDVKIVVVNEKMSFFTRPIRKNDFRASGGGIFEYRKELVPENVLITARDITKKFGMQKIGFDFVIDNRSGEGKITEMCCEFSHTGIIGAGGYWDFDLNWHHESLNPSHELIKMLVKMKSNNSPC